MCAVLPIPRGICNGKSVLQGIRHDKGGLLAGCLLKFS